MSTIRYEVEMSELHNFNPKLLYLTQSEYGTDWHSTQHYHPFLELLYVIEGRGEFIIDSKSFLLQRGDLVIINPYTIHTEKSSENCPLKYYVFGIDNLKLDLSSAQAQLEEDKDKEKSDFSPLFHNLKDYDRNLKYIRVISEELQKKEPYFEMMAYHRLCCLLIPILRENHLTFVKPLEEKSATKEIIFAKQYIEKHFTSDISLDELAQKSFINKYHLVHYFSLSYGISPIKYLNTCRLREAKSLLRTTDMNITSIANAVGFISSSFFAKKFRDAFFISPTEYRNNSLQKNN